MTTPTCLLCRSAIEKHHHIEFPVVVVHGEESQCMTHASCIGRFRERLEAAGLEARVN